MAWVDSGGTIVDGAVSGLDTYKVTIRASGFWERRTSPTDPNVTQIRSRSLVENEYRGLSYSQANTIAVSSISGTGDKSWTRTLVSIGGGGYNVIESIETITGDWTDTIIEA
jgi:hypothetical protein